MRACKIRFDGRSPGDHFRAVLRVAAAVCHRGAVSVGLDPLSVLVLRFGCSMILMGGYLVLTRRQIRKHFDIRALLFGFCMAGSALGYYVAGQRIGFSLAVMLLFAQSV